MVALCCVYTGCLGEVNCSHSCVRCCSTGRRGLDCYMCSTRPSRGIRQTSPTTFFTSIQSRSHWAKYVKLENPVLVMQAFTDTLDCATIGPSPGLCSGLHNICGFCGPALTLGLIPLQICLPEKLLWWNVRQEKGSRGQTEELFSLSLCFTLFNGVQNPHFLVRASMIEYVKCVCKQASVCVTQFL